MTDKTDNPDVIALPPLLYGVAFGLALFLRWLWPLPILQQGVAFWFGLFLLSLGGGFALWGQRTMRAAGTNVNPSLPTTTLVTSGPFRLSRNPLYLALNVLYVGLTFTTNTWWGFVTLIPLLLLMHYGVILREESYLEHKFGETYKTYCLNVRRYL